MPTFVGDESRTMNELTKNPKPLGGKSYGSIPHLPGSRMGPAEHCISDGQRDICCVKARDSHDVIIVQEKLDGSNVGVAKINGEIVPLTRSGYVANTSPYRQHSVFHEWAIANRKRFDELLKDGQRVCGEWLYQAHGTRYSLPHEPFVAFDIIELGKRSPWKLVEDMCFPLGFTTPQLLRYGKPVSIELVLGWLDYSGHGAIDPVEGAVWRVERKGVVDFLAKYVRPDKKDGKYLPEISGEAEVINTYPT